MKKFLLMTCMFVQPVFAEPFTVSGEDVSYNAESIEDEHPSLLLDIIKRHKDISRLVIEYNLGGNIDVAKEMIYIIMDAGLDTHVEYLCASSCVDLFIAGKKRTISDPSHIGLHRSKIHSEELEKFYLDNRSYNGWANTYDLGSFLYGFGQEMAANDVDYYTSRGVDLQFVIRILLTDEDDEWYPTHEELKEAGVIN